MSTVRIEVTNILSVQLITCGA